jgi:hypothetical protein
MAEDRKLKATTVRDIKAIEPKAEVYEINKHSKYLVMIKKSLLVGGNELAHAKAKEVFKAFAAHGIAPIMIVGVDDDVKFYELGEIKKQP